MKTKGIAKFEKVSKERFTSSAIERHAGSKNVHTYDNYTEDDYNMLKLPKRATKGSAGYDFYAPGNFTVYPGLSILIPTGIRAKIDEGWTLQIYPRSSLGFKYNIHLNNTVGIIDSDYYESDNEGHIFIKMTNFGEDVVEILQGQAFAQGIFVPFGMVEDDNVEEIRNGGFGSTNK